MPTYRHIQSVVPPGEYDVTVMSATLAPTKAGDEMMVLRLSAPGSSKWFFDRLVFAERFYWKIAQFLTAMGKQLTGDEEIDPLDYVCRSGRAIVGVHDFNGRPENFIKRWLPPKSNAGTVISAEPASNDEGGSR
jgi:hypothetical protein